LTQIPPREVEIPPGEMITVRVQLERGE